MCRRTGTCRRTLPASSPGGGKFTLFPTDQLKNLYVGPLDFTLAGQPTSLVNLEEPDFERHPRVEGCA